jgi:tetratricopeptide (TPR) repeat protein
MVWLQGCRNPRPSGGAPASRSVAITNIAPAQAVVSENALVAAHAHYATAVAAEARDAQETALDEYSAAAINDPTNESLLLEVSQRMLEAGEPRRAVELLTNATARAQAPGSLYAVLGFIYSRLGELNQAEAANRSAIQRAPRSIAGYQNLFLDDLQNKRQADALKVLDDASKVPGTDAEFMVGLAELCHRAPAGAKSAHDRVLPLLQRAEKMHPTDEFLLVRLADALDAAGSRADAARVYQQVLDEASQPEVRRGVRVKLVDIYRREHDDKAASEQLKALLREQPDDPEAYYLLGSMASAAGKNAEAAENFSKAVLLKPDFVEAYYDLALAQLNQEKPADALSTLEQARAQAGSSFYLEYLDATAFTRQTNYDEAIRHFTTAEILIKAEDPATVPNLHLFYFEFGAACERKGDVPEAEKCFEKCLAIAPDFAEAQNYLGYMWADRGEKLDRAHDLIEKAVKAEPKNAAYLDSLGWVLYKLNRAREALPYELKAIQLSDTEDATLFDHVGDIYSALGETGKAREAWRKSLSLEASDTVRKKLEASPPQ